MQQKDYYFIIHNIHLKSNPSEFEKWTSFRGNYKFFCVEGFFFFLDENDRNSSFRPNKKIFLFTVTRPTLYLIADPNCFYPSLEIRKSHVGTFNFYIHLNRSSVWNRNRKWKKKHGDNIYVHMFSAVWRMRTHKANAVNIGIYPGVRSITWGKWKGSRFWSTRQTTWWCL